tara:strand:+ start:4629 stop:5243 length:615 start_codon:yes stop_codon:yes gene_type:complete
MSDDSSLDIRLIYLHGFNSSPVSQKAKSLNKYAQDELGSAANKQKFEVLTPNLPYKPEKAMVLVEELMEGADNVVLIGSSLGGFYSIYLAEKYQCKAVLVNPLVTLKKDLADNFIGRHINPYSHEEFEIGMQDAEYLLSLELASIKNQTNYFLLLEEGDEVLDYRLALAKFPQARQRVLSGGTHRFENFERYLPEIMDFAELQH